VRAKERHPLARLLLDNRRHWPGIALLVSLVLPAGIFKTLTATYWGAAVDLGKIAEMARTRS